jgi:putative ABC transport system substrate-binding protein
VIEQRSAGGMYERLPELTTELINLKVDLILSGGTSATRAAQKSVSRIPIVMATSTDDPVTSGFVASLAHPGGNITGLTSIARELSGKRLELLKETVAKASRVAVLWNANNPGHQLRLKEIELVAPALGISLQPVAVKSVEDLENAFRAAGTGPTNAVMISADALFNSNRKLLADLAIKNRLATTYDRDDFVEVGGLMSYGVDVDDLYRRAATYADKILKEPSRRDFRSRSQ